MTETRLAILRYLSDHGYVRWEHIVKELEGYKNFPGVDEELRKLLGERNVEKMFTPDDPPECSIKLSVKGYQELMDYERGYSFQQLLEQDVYPVKVPEDHAGEKGSKDRKERLENRKTKLEFLVRYAFGFLCGCFLFSHPVIIFLLLLFLAYTYVVKM